MRCIGDLLSFSEHFACLTKCGGFFALLRMTRFGAELLDLFVIAGEAGVGFVRVQSFTVTRPLVISWSWSLVLS